MQIQNMIARYAQLLAGVERGAARGQEAPPQVLDEMNRLYSRASAMLSPAEQQQALAAVDSMKAQFHQQYDIQAAQADAQAAGYYTDKLAKDATGLDYDQMLKAARGEKFERKGRGVDNLQRYENNVKSAAEMLGKPNWTRKQFEAAVDRYSELKLHRGPDRAAEYLTAQFGEHADHARRILSDYENSGIGLTVALAERRGVDPDHYVQPTEDLQLRSQIAEAWAETAAKDEGTRAHLASADDIDRTYLEDDTARGDIARAMHEAEMKQERQERTSYRPTEYTIEDQDDVRISAY